MSSLRRADLLALSNLRNDGRKPEEIRRMTIQLSPLAAANGTNGSALVRMGLTTVLCAVIGPMDCSRRSDELPDRAILEVNFRTAPFASSSGDRRTSNPSTDRKIKEHSSLIQNAIEASLLLNLHPKTKIILDITVLADDGGRLCAAINAATCALIDSGLPMKDLVCACSAGLVNGAYASADGLQDVELMDLNQKEISTYQNESSSVYLPCAIMPQRNSVVLAQCESRLSSVKVFEKVLAAAMEGCQLVFKVMEASIRERTGNLLAAKAGNAAIQNVPL
jgi:exosome complex component RRP41